MERGDRITGDHAGLTVFWGVGPCSSSNPCNLGENKWPEDNFHGAWEVGAALRTPQRIQQHSSDFQAAGPDAYPKDYFSCLFPPSTFQRTLSWPNSPSNTSRPHLACTWSWTLTRSSRSWNHFVLINFEPSWPSTTFWWTLTLGASPCRATTVRWWVLVKVASVNSFFPGFQAPGQPGHHVAFSPGGLDRAHLRFQRGCQEYYADVSETDLEDRPQEVLQYLGHPQEGPQPHWECQISLNPQV